MDPSGRHYRFWPTDRIPFQLALGPDGAIYFTVVDVVRDLQVIDRLDIGGVLTEFPHTRLSTRYELRIRHDGSLYFGGLDFNNAALPSGIVRLERDGRVKFLPLHLGPPVSIDTLAAARGNVCFIATTYDAQYNPKANNLYRIRADGTMAEVASLGRHGAEADYADDLVVDQGGDVWFTKSSDNGTHLYFYNFGDESRGRPVRTEHPVRHWVARGRS